MKLLILFTVFALGQCASVEKRSDDPADYKLASDGYYYKFYYEIKTWAEAEKICRNEGGHLAIIWDARTLDIVLILLHEHRTEQNRIWVGATDQWTEGRWQTPLKGDVPIEPWGYREPNNGGNYDFDEDCVELTNWEGLWNDAECSNERPFPCQRKGSEECRLSKDAKFLEGLVRAELMVVKMTHSRELHTFLLNKTMELRNSMNAALHLFEVTATDEDGIGGRLASSANRWSPVRHLFEAMDNLQQINATHSEILLSDSHNEISNLLYGMQRTGSHHFKRQLILILESALRRCRRIVENGCKENPTATPTSYPWETTWNPWETTWNPRPTHDPRETTWNPRPTHDPWETTWNPWETTRWWDKGSQIN